MKTSDFIELVWDYYAKHSRDLPWRHPDNNGHFDPYNIVVSELMLQQTQVQRVIPKYAEFLSRFPSIESLAGAPLLDVLAVWSGLGYNRRAKFLHLLAQKVCNDYDGQIPNTHQELITLPGIGANTAGAVLAYAFNAPSVFIETNIRTCYIHHFFPNQQDVPDKEIAALVNDTVDPENPREWYWALMDYGSHLKATEGNSSKFSSSYKKQSKFEGSLRQLRGQVVKQLTTRSMTLSELSAVISDQRLERVLATLESEEMITRTGNTYHI